jgi:hypothetical protein
MTSGSSRESVIDEELVGGGLTNSLMAAALLYSSSAAFLFLYRKRNTTPPIIAAKAITPTTHPTAMPTLLGPPDPLEFDGFVLGACVTTTVEPPTVTIWSAVAVLGLFVGAAGADDGS